LNYFLLETKLFMNWGI